MSTNSWRRLIAGVFAVALLGAGIMPAQAAVSPSATQAGSWLAGELSDGLIHNPNFGGFDDYGLSLDVLMALQEADTQGAKQDAIVSAMRKNIKAYVFNFPSKGPADGVWAGSAAKALVAVQGAGKDDEDFGGINLVDLVEGTIEPSGGDKGRLKDRDIPGYPDPSTPADYSNLLYQAFGLQGLAEAHSARVDDVRDFLLKQQCAPGYFRLYFDACKVDVDATAIAIRAMAAAKADGVGGLDAALSKATSWLLKQQRPDGSFGGGESTPAPNTNSTGLAASALGLRGEISAARKAAAWIYTLQVKASTSGKLAAEDGAVALAGESWDAGVADGVTEATEDQWRRATAQAIYGLIHLDPATIDTRIVTKIPKPVVRDVTKTRIVVVNSPTDVVAGSKGSAGTLGAYLAEQLSNGDHVEIRQEGETLVDYDLTADTILGLRLLGQQGASSKRATAFLLDDKSVDAYAHGVPYEKKASYAAPLAKLVIAGVLAGEGENKTVMGLAEELAGLQNADGGFDDVGKYADASTGTARQSLIALALLMSDQPEAEAAVKRLIDGQCKDGGFPAHLADECAEGDPTATGWALQAINAVDADDRPADGALDEPAAGWDDSRDKVVTDAVAYLQGIVRVDGAVADDAGRVDVRTTSAATAGRQSVGLDGRIAARTLGGLQLDDGGFAAKGDKPDLALSTAVAAGVGANSWLGVRASGLVGGWILRFSGTPAAATPAESSSAADDDDALTVSRPVAYSVAGLAGLLALGALGLGVGRLVRKPA